MEKLRRLLLLLQTGIQDYESALQTLEQERLKYLRLAMTDSFGTDENSSRESWLAHLQALESNLQARLNALRQAVVNAAVEIQADLNSSATTSPSSRPNEEPPSEKDKV